MKCYESHPPLKLGDTEIYGGAAHAPVPSGVDIYVSLQDGSSCGKPSDPWDKVVEVRYPIHDGKVPTNLPRFKSLVTWLCTQLHAGKKIHVGCIGGHGRTGLLLAAVTAEFLGKKDAIQYVRDNYCKRAVESTAQVDFLVAHYGVSPVSASRDDYKASSFYHPPKDKAKGKKISRNFDEYIQSKAATITAAHVSTGSGVAFSEVVRPIKNSPRCIW
jgi:hypothetical protein